MRGKRQDFVKRFFTTPLVVMVGFIFFIFSSLSFALKPPTKEQIAKYKKDKTWTQRAAKAKKFGNHKASSSVVAHAVYRLKRLALELEGKTGKEIDAKLTPPPAWIGMPTRGTVNVLALLIDFSDYPSTNSSSLITSKLFGDGNTNEFPLESLRNYYRRSSYNQLEITGNVIGWYRPSYPRSSIIETDDGRENLIKEVLNYYDSQGYDFSQYDNNNDGTIDYFIVIWAGPESGWASFWWGYQAYFRDTSYLLDGKKLSAYSWQAESDYPLLEFYPGTVIHETGHALGLPDYYDYDDTVGPDGGVGYLDMMDSNWGDHNCFSKFLLDWVTPSVFKSGNNTVTIRASGTYTDAVIFMPGADSSQTFYEFFMVQNRYRTANDPDNYPADGLLIWHVDAQLNIRGTDFQYDNSYTDQKLLRLMEADGLEEIETGDSWADSGDYYINGNSFGPNTTPSSNSYYGYSTQMGIRNISSPGTVMSFEVYGPSGIPYISLGRTYLYFGGVVSGSAAGSQNFTVDNSGEGTLSWSVTANVSWLSCSPSSGTNPGIVTVSVDPTGLAPGTYTGTITAADPNAFNSPQTVTVTLNVYPSGATSGPFGIFSTPIDGSTVYSSIAVTGWVLDDLGVSDPEIYRDPVSGEGPGLIYIGDAVFVEGARPDVEQAYPGYPMNYKAGWGYMLLTNFLPGGGNGTFRLYSIVSDVEGNQVTLGTKTITCDNANAVKPFGAIDTPTQGGTASGSNFVNWGWVLTPPPNSIATDGSTINVWVDGVNIGNPTYNKYNSTIAFLFPGYANSNGAYGYFYLDTTTYSNGVHTIQWTATDSASNTDGIGSRYFTIQDTNNSESNSLSGVKSRNQNISVPGIERWENLPINGNIPVKIRKGFGKNIESREVYHDEEGFIKIETRELQRVEFDFSAGTANNSQIFGYMLVGNQIHSLPTGTTLDSKNGKFYWLPGPGFVGEYRFVFIEKRKNAEMSRKNIIVKILPKFGR